MPHPLATDAQLCTLFRADGGRCNAPKMRGKDYCAAHDPNRASSAGRYALPVPTHSLADLLSLDPVNPETLSLLRRGLAQHIVAGTILANAAAQVMRFMSEEAAAAPRKDRSASDAMVAKVLASTPPPVDD